MEPFTSVDLKDLTNLTVADIKSFGKFYSGNKEVADLDDEFHLDFDEEIEEAVGEEIVEEVK